MFASEEQDHIVPKSSIMLTNFARLTALVGISACAGTDSTVHGKEQKLMEPHVARAAQVDFGAIICQYFHEDEASGLDYIVTHKYCLVKDKGEVPMKALRLGDKGRVANNEYESIYSFGHKNNETVTDFLQIFMEGSSHADCIRPLELSKDHMVFISSNQQGHGRAVPASIPRHLLD